MATPDNYGKGHFMSLGANGEGAIQLGYHCVLNLDAY